MSGRRLRLVLLIVAVAGLVWLRIEIVKSWHQPAGDGVQYYRVSEELRERGRLAFGPPPLPLSYGRLPGYPLLMALAGGRTPIGLGAHVYRAAQWNVLFDVLSALFLFLAARRCGFRRAWLAALLVLALPTLWLMSCYALTEPISMLAVCATLYCAIALAQTGKIAFALAAGAITGFSLLIRFDALCMVPLVAYACWKAPLPLRRRLTTLAATAGCAIVIYSPWPIRNLVQFGAPHFAATTWRSDDGQPLPTGPVSWARTWADSEPGDSFFELYFVYRQHYQIERPYAVPIRSYESEAERQRLVKILEQYNRHGLDKEVNDSFISLANDRFHEHPFRTLVVLPLRRISRLFRAEPEYEMPMKIDWLSLPQRRPWFIRADWLVLFFSVVGSLLLFLNKQRFLLWLTLPAIFMRLAIYAFAIPQATTQRYAVEAFPLFILLAVGAVSELERIVRNHLGGRVAP